MLEVFAGLFAGALHVMAGPDHLAAIAPLVVDGAKGEGCTPRRGGAWSLGVRWGLGHGTGLALVAALCFCFRDALPIERLSAWSERFVGLALVAVGLWGLRRAFASRLHMHVHRHGGELHAHYHVHVPSQPEPERSHAHGHAAFAVGSLHGLGGSAHFLGVLPALALPSTTAAALYLVAFATGTVLAMAAFSAAIGACSKGFAAAGERVRGAWLGACSLATICIGAAWSWL